MLMKNSWLQVLLHKLQCKSTYTSVIILITLLLGSYWLNAMGTKKEELKIAFNGPWMNIHPGLQHTLVGDLTLSNQFEALVGFNDNGVYTPLAAKSWTFSADYKKLVFVIDNSKMFSDGKLLQAIDFKNSWEKALSLDPKSTNSSLLDVLYKVEGFADFEKTGHITGIIANDSPNESILEIHFSTPFRMALEHLSGNRFSAYREIDGKFIGTGAYLIDELSKDHLKLKPNKNYEHQPKDDIDLTVVTSKAAVQGLLDGKIDVMAYAIGATISSDLAKHENLSFIVGQDAVHRALYPNAQPGRLFSKKEFRQALQFLAYDFYSKNLDVLGNKDFTTLDMQVYLPHQAGRIDEQLVLSQVETGKKYVEALRKASQKNPVVLLETEEYSLRPFLDAAQIKISEKSRVLPKSEIIAAIYDGKEADIIPGAFGVASGDPDGIYHLLGKNGAITSPMLQNKKVSDLLEEGRKLISSEEINPFYQKVSHAILDEAPITHLGFNKAVAIYRNDKVKVTGRILRRNEGHLHIFEAK